MIKVEQIMDIKMLSREGLSIRAIAERTGHSRNTIRRVLRKQHPMKYQQPERHSKLEAYHQYIIERYNEYRLNAVKLHQEVFKMGYQGSVDTVRRFVQTLKEKDHHRAKATVRFETQPGQQAQVDWGECGQFEDPITGKHRKLYVFIMTFGYSRMMYVQFTWSMQMPTFIACHEAAFKSLGGCCQSILYDNMKQVRLSSSTLNPTFIDFASHYGFVPKTHRPYRARTKGKVERMVDYVKDSFLAGCTFNGLDDLNSRVMHWLDHTAHVRIHGTTGEQPIIRFANEKEHLIDTSKQAAYVLVEPAMRRVDAESHVQFNSNRYSVPSDHVGKEVAIHARGGTIIVRCGDTIIAEHREATGKGQCLTEPDHLADLWKQTLARSPLNPATAASREGGGAAPARDSIRWHVQLDGTPPMIQTPLEPAIVGPIVVEHRSLSCYEEVIQ